MAQKNPDRLRRSQVAALIGVSVSTLAKWSARGEGPQPHRLGERIVYYLRSEIEEYLADCDAKPAVEKHGRDHGGRK